MKKRLYATLILLIYTVISIFSLQAASPPEPNLAKKEKTEKEKLLKKQKLAEKKKKYLKRQKQKKKEDCAEQLEREMTTNLENVSAPTSEAQVAELSYKKKPNYIPLNGIDLKGLSEELFFSCFERPDKNDPALQAFKQKNRHLSNKKANYAWVRQEYIPSKVDILKGILEEQRLEREHPQTLPTENSLTPSPHSQSPDQNKEYDLFMKENNIDPHSPEDLEKLRQAWQNLKVQKQELLAQDHASTPVDPTTGDSQRALAHSQPSVLDDGRGLFLKTYYSDIDPQNPEHLERLRQAWPFEERQKPLNQDYAPTPGDPTTEHSQRALALPRAYEREKEYQKSIRRKKRIEKIEEQSDNDDDDRVHNLIDAYSSSDDEPPLFTKRETKKPEKRPVKKQMDPNLVDDDSVSNQDHPPRRVDPMAENSQRALALARAYEREIDVETGLDLGNFPMDSSSELEQKKSCNTCGETKPSLLACGLCKNTYYCNKICQQQSWSIHKKQCLGQQSKKVAEKPSSQPLIETEKEKAEQRRLLRLKSASESDRGLLTLVPKHAQVDFRLPDLSDPKIIKELKNYTKENDDIDPEEAKKYWMDEYIKKETKRIELLQKKEQKSESNISSANPSPLALQPDEQLPSDQDLPPTHPSLPPEFSRYFKEIKKIADNLVNKSLRALTIETELNFNDPETLEKLANFINNERQEGNEENILRLSSKWVQKWIKNVWENVPKEKQVEIVTARKKQRELQEQQQQEQKRQELLKQHELRMKEQRQAQEKQIEQEKIEKSTQLAIALQNVQDNPGNKVYFETLMALYNTGHRFTGEHTPLEVAFDEIIEAKKLGYRAATKALARRSGFVADQATRESKPHKGKGGKGQKKERGAAAPQTRKTQSTLSTAPKLKKAERPHLQQVLELPPVPDMSPAERLLWSSSAIAAQVQPPAPASELLPAIAEDEAKLAAADTPVAKFKAMPHGSRSLLFNVPHISLHHKHNDPRYANLPVKYKKENGYYTDPDTGKTMFSPEWSKEKLFEMAAAGISNSNTVYSKNHGRKTICAGIFPEMLGDDPRYPRRFKAILTRGIVITLYGLTEEEYQRDIEKAQNNNQDIFRTPIPAPQRPELFLPIFEDIVKVPRQRRLLSKMSPQEEQRQERLFLEVQRQRKQQQSAPEFPVEQPSLYASRPEPTPPFLLHDHSEQPWPRPREMPSSPWQQGDNYSWMDHAGNYRVTRP